MGCTVRVDPDFCMGAQRCIYLAPDVFTLRDDGVADVVNANVLDEQRAREIAEECPNSAILVDLTVGFNAD